MVQGRVMGRCVQRTDQDESFANESAEFMRIAARPSALTSNLVNAAINLIRCAKRIEIYVEIRYLGRQWRPKTLKTAGLRSLSE